MVNRSRVKSGQESVWDYPRPPRRARRVLETSHPPVYYVLPEDVRMEHLTPSDAASLCEWKGRARYYDIVTDEREERRVAWFYPDPTLPFKGGPGSWGW